ncbi:UNVERIFIED_CONTAM: hypothetical protein GTU68_036408, partial [Idotea baltica]|nr:hypothetical protein [Idotea baltica]
MNTKQQYILHLADNALILGQRLGDWCGHGPILEQDMALTNIALDLVGQARLYYQYAAELDLNGVKTEDDFAYFRHDKNFYNCLLVEVPNGDFGKTIIRQLFYSVFNYAQLNSLLSSADDQLRAVAEKSIKEVKYHVRFSREWTLRLGDGTDESHRRMQDAVDELWGYLGELFIPTIYETTLLKEGVSVDVQAIKDEVMTQIKAFLTEATLAVPDHNWIHSGGKEGRHTEHLSYLLADMQILQ